MLGPLAIAPSATILILCNDWETLDNFLEAIQIFGIIHVMIHIMLKCSPFR